MFCSDDLVSKIHVCVRINPVYHPDAHPAANTKTRAQTILVFRDLQAAFDSASRVILWSFLYLNGVWVQFISLFQPQY